MQNVKCEMWTQPAKGFHISHFHIWHTRTKEREHGDVKVGEVEGVVSFEEDNRGDPKEVEDAPKEVGDNPNEVKADPKVEVNKQKG